MATNTQKPAPFKLRARIRNRRRESSDLRMRTELIDRIGDLRGIETVERRDDTVPCQVDVYLKRDASDRVRKVQSPPLLYSLNCQGVMVSGLDRWAQHQVLCGGWGKLIFDQVLVFLPRDNKELDVVWKILQRAYNNLYVPSARERGSQVLSTWDRPKFSRTILH